MSGPFGSSQWMYNAGGDFYGFPISNSLRFNVADAAFLSRTPGSASNRRTWTWSGWVKRGNLGTFDALFTAGTGGSDKGGIFFHTGNTVYVYHDGVGTLVNIKTVAVLRDPSAWYHIVVAMDTTQATAANRVKIYINGVLQSLTITGSPDEDAELYWNDDILHEAGSDSVDTDYLDGYLAEVNFIDGTALTPSSFGELKNDIWIPKDTSGLTFGTNGFRQQFKQVGTGTASSTTIGADTSGNDNHWTSTNLVASDVMPDSPTSNFATYNAVDNPAGAILSEGNLKCTSDASYNVVFGTISFSSGKYYWEQNSTSGNAVDAVSVATTALVPDQRDNNTGNTIHSINWYAFDGGGSRIYWNGTLHVENLTAWGAGDVMSVACDMDNKTIQFRKNNVLIYTASSDANGNITNTWDDMIPAWAIGSAIADKHSVVNFGQDSSFAGQETAQGNTDENGIGDFYYAPPSGYLALCTANLPDPVATIDPAQGGSPQDYFNTVLYTGNGSARSITGVGFQPDWVWFKNRESAYGHEVYDVVRGTELYLPTQATNGDIANAQGLTAFGSDGFSIGTDPGLNQDTKGIVAWNWKAGTSFSNDASATGVGSIDSAGSVNTDVGFSVITATTNGDGIITSAAHGLGVTPEMIIMKSRTVTQSWYVYHKNSTATATQGTLNLNTTDAVNTTNGVSGGVDKWTVSSTTFGAGNAAWNYPTDTGHVFYCFASVDGYSKFGGYTGNGSADGAFVYTGFRPAYIVIKCSSASGRSWIIKDSARNIVNVAGNTLLADDSAAEYTSNTLIDIISNGFKPRDTSTSSNQSGATYIYMAFAEQPFKYANGR